MHQLLNRRSLILTAGAGLFLGRPAGALAEASPRDTGGLRPAEVVLTDVRGTSKQDYSSGQFLAFQAVNDPAADRHQTVTVFPATFPQKTLLKWNWPDDADDRVKSWNGIDYGNYLNTITPVAVVSSKINAISSLLHEVDIEYEAPSDSANVTLDFFLYSSDSSTEATMLCEIQVFLHATSAAKRFMSSLQSLGVYESSAVGRSSPIKWAVTRQQSNFFKTPYYLFCPSDGSDQLASTIDVRALLSWLRSMNRKTGQVYLTGEEYFNGLATGVEPIKKSGSARFRSISVAYSI